jgi:hypothetical protein
MLTTIAIAAPEVAVATIRLAAFSAITTLTVAAAQLKASAHILELNC